MDAAKGEKAKGMNRQAAYNKLTEAADLMKHVQAQARQELSGLKLTEVELAKVTEAHQAVLAALREMDRSWGKGWGGG